VSEPSDPVPQRIGDAERDQAATLLREALAQGRLDNEEFDERINKALTAKTAADLEPLFRDLPGPKPGAGVAPFQAPPWQQPAAASAAGNEVASPAPAAAPMTFDDRMTRVLGVIAGLAWPAVIITLFATSWHYWWLIFIPVFLSSMAGGSHHRDRDRGRRHRAIE
jgi:hypothetical protein